MSTDLKFKIKVYQEMSFLIINIKILKFLNQIWKFNQLLTVLDQIKAGNFLLEIISQ
jgi:hypothetical protein